MSACLVLGTFNSSEIDLSVLVKSDLNVSQKRSRTQTEIDLNESEIDLNEREHFLKAN